MLQDFEELINSLHGNKKAVLTLRDKDEFILYREIGTISDIRQLNIEALISQYRPNWIFISDSKSPLPAVFMLEPPN